jgi:AraC-like DNA-binding protein
MSAEGASSKVKAFIAAAKEHDHEWFTVFEAADSVGLSVRQLRRIVENEIGYSPHVLLHLVRIDSVAKEIEHTEIKLKEVAKAHQFADSSSMTRQFKRFVGITPGQFRRRWSSAPGRMRQPALFERDY